MKRWYEERYITYRNWQNHLNLHRESNLAKGISPDDIKCICDKQIGRFRKKDAYDCGKTECFICHSDKVLGYKKPQERIADIRFIEQTNEYFLLANNNQVLKRNQ